MASEPVLSREVYAVISRGQKTHWSNFGAITYRKPHVPSSEASDLNHFESNFSNWNTIQLNWTRQGFPVESQCQIRSDDEYTWDDTVGSINIDSEVEADGTWTGVYRKETGKNKKDESCEKLRLRGLYIVLLPPYQPCPPPTRDQNSPPPLLVLPQ